MKTRIAVTGAGVVSPIGSGLPAFAEALFAGKCAFGPSALLPAAPITAEVRDFQPQQWLGTKGIRMLDRSSRLLCVATHLALESAKLATADEGADPEIGLVCGTLFGSVHSIAAFDWSGLVDGTNYVNPMEFPNTVINSPAGQAAIRYRLGGVNSTICAGLASGLYAIHYAAESLRFGRALTVLAGGVEELCKETIRGFQRTGLDAGAHDALPFDPASGGLVPGEGSTLLVLENSETASARGVTPMMEISGFGACHSACELGSFQLTAEAATAAIEEALSDANVTPGEIGCIVASASGNRPGDVMEERALRNVFNGRLGAIPVCAPKAAYGESMGAAGAFAALIAGLSLQAQCLPPTAGFRGSGTRLRLSGERQPLAGDYALVNAFSCDGNNAALVVKRWQ